MAARPVEQQSDLTPEQIFHPAATPNAFGEYVTGLRAAAHHQRWLTKAVDPNINRLLIVAPIESAKTTWMTMLLAWHIGNNPLSTNFIGSVTDDQAVKRLKEIRSLIEESSAWKQVFPHIAPDYKRGWTDHSLHVWDTHYEYSDWIEKVSREGQLKSATLLAAGVGSSVVIGNRFTGITLIDDPHDEKNSRSKLQRERVDSWLKQTVISRVTETGKVILITTRWHRDDIAGRLMTNPAWHTDETSAIVKDAETGQDVSYWPEHWPMTRLLGRKLEVGSAYFKAQYLNDPSGLAGELIDVAWFQDVPERLPLPFKRVAVSADLAISLKDSADYTAVAVLALDIENNLYILGMWRGRWTFNSQLSVVRRVAHAAERTYGRLDWVLVEKVAYQQAAIQELSRTSTLPIIGVAPVGDKVLRANRWIVRLEQVGVFADKSAAWWPSFADECTDFSASSEHDDQIDAISQFWQRVGGSQKIGRTQWPSVMDDR